MGVRNIFIYPVEAINALRTNVWAVALIIVGSVLVLHGHGDVGGSLSTGGFAILRSESSQAQQSLTPGSTPAPGPDPK